MTAAAKNPAMSASDLYEADYVRWTEQQAALLRGMPGDACPQLDCGNLAEEIEDMGRAEIRAVSSLLMRVVAHLLKIALAPDAQSVGHRTAEALTLQGAAVLSLSPGLRRRIDLERIWKLARNTVARTPEAPGETAPPLPARCPLDLDELLDPEFDPARAAKRLADAVRAAGPGRT
jgi:Domain of unknown function DUF29